MQRDLMHFLDFIDSAAALAWVRAIIVMAIGLLIAQICARLVGRMAMRRMDRHRGVLTRRLVFYSILILAIVLGLRQVSHDISNIFLGAAGILTVALGFASQTSASNLISGLFLIGEKSFALGDVIKIGDTTGEVLSIDLLSVKLRTFDNLFVRVPNEMLVKSEITNLTRFPIRRIDLQIGVGYKEDLGRVHEVLLEVADNHPLCLIEPRPTILFQQFGDSSLNLQFSVWTQSENYTVTRTGLAEDIKRTFDRHGIELPYPYRSLTTGSLAEPFPVRIVQEVPGTGKSKRP